MKYSGGGGGNKQRFAKQVREDYSKTDTVKGDH